MKVDLQRHGTVTVVVPQDALTEATVPDLQAALEREGLQNAVRLVLDLGPVAYVDSAGIEFLLAFCGSPPPPSARRDTTTKGTTAAASDAAPRPARAREASAGGLRPRLAGLNDTVREALYLTDTVKRFSIFDSVPAAVRSYV